MNWLFKQFLTLNDWVERTLHPEVIEERERLHIQIEDLTSEAEVLRWEYLQAYLRGDEAEKAKLADRIACVISEIAPKKTILRQLGDCTFVVAHYDD